MRRSRPEIILAILKFCREAKNKTQIVYGCNLNFKNSKSYIEELQGKNFLHKDGSKWRTTELGNAVIIHLEKSGVVDSVSG